MKYKKEDLKWTEHNELMLVNRFVMLDVKLYDNEIELVNDESYFYDIFSVFNGWSFTEESKQMIIDMVYRKLCLFSQLFEEE